MKVTIYSDTSAFEAVKAEEWHALLNKSATDVIFLTWEWQATWWKHLQPGELLLLVYRDTLGELLGIVPLFRTRRTSDVITLSIVGCEEISDYLDVIVQTQHEQAICSHLISFLLAEDAPPWDEIRLCNLRRNSTAYRVLAEEATRVGLSVSVSEQDVCPIISLPKDWNAYLAGLDKKRRHEIRRKIRRAENQAHTRWYIADPSSRDLDEEMEAFITLHRLSDPAKNMFMDDKRPDFFKEVARCLAKRGWLCLSFLEIDNEKAASLLSFNYNDSFQVYNSGYDPHKHANLSPGIVLLSYNIRHAIELGRSTFDFLRGDEEYKFRFGAKPVPVHELLITRPGDKPGDST